MRLVHLTETESTTRAVGPGDPPWTVILADRQGGGRGQHGRTWHSPPGGLYTSIVIPPDAISPVFTLLAGVAVLEACEQAAGARGIGLKWVNDLVYDHRKLGGLLANVVHTRQAILGIGLNLVPVDVPEAAWLEEAAPGPVDRFRLLDAIVARLRESLERWRADGPQPVVAGWCARSVTIGQDVRVAAGGEDLVGHAAGLDPHGRLLLELPGGQIRPIASGSVRLADGTYA